MQFLLTETMINRLLEHNPNTLGELLRDICFTDDGMGCYSNFDLIKDFEPFQGRVSDALLYELLGDGLFDPEEVKRVYAYRNDFLGITVLWHWDGDGTLIFHSSSFTLVNNDCKTAYDWQVVDLDAKAAEHHDYIASRRAEMA